MRGEATPHVIVRDPQHNLAAAVECDPAATENLVIRLTPGAILQGQSRMSKAAESPAHRCR